MYGKICEKENLGNINERNTILDLLNMLYHFNTTPWSNKMSHTFRYEKECYDTGSDSESALQSQSYIVSSFTKNAASKVIKPPLINCRILLNRVCQLLSTTVIICWMAFVLIVLLLNLIESLM